MILTVELMGIWNDADSSPPTEFKGEMYMSAFSPAKKTGVLRIANFAPALHRSLIGTSPLMPVDNAVLWCIVLFPTWIALRWNNNPVSKEMAGLVADVPDVRVSDT